MRSPIKYIALAAALLMAGLPPRVMAYTAQWTQFDWSAPSVSTAVHPGNTDGWTAYDAKSGTITYIPGTGLQFQNLYYNWTTTDNSISTAGFNYTGATWTSPILPSGTLGASLSLFVADPAAPDGSFDTAVYTSGIPGITKVSATQFTIDTNNASRNGYYKFSDFVIRSGVTVTATGLNKLLLTSSGTIKIEGILNASGTNGTGPASCSPGYAVAGGPGGGRGTSGALAGEGLGGSPHSMFNVGSSGGGASFGGLGGVGSGGSVGSRGQAYGDAALSPFYGGSGGSGTGHSNCCSSSGGGGGGAVYFIANQFSVAATGIIRANGGNGSSSNCGYGSSGGGSGGGIVINSAIATNSGVIEANGGAGGTEGSYRGGGGGGGIIRINSANYSGSGTVSVAGGASSGNPGQAGIFSTSLPGAEFTGLYTSGVFDTGGTFDLSDIYWSSAASPGGNIVVEVRAGNSAVPDGSWTVWAPYGNGASLGGSMDYMRYVQWRATLTSPDPLLSPFIYDLTVRYLGYDQAWNSLVSSVYDTGSSSNSLRMVRWGENAPFPADAGLRVRTSPDALNWTSWMGPDGTSSTWFTDPVGAETIPYPLRDGVNDRYFQYLVLMKGSGNNTPTVSVATVTYGTISEPQLTLLTPQASHQLVLDFVDYADDEDDFRISTSVAGDPTNDVGIITTGNKPGTGAQSGVMSGLIPNTLYFVRLRAHENAKGAYSAFSNKVSTYTLAALPVPSTVPYSMSGNLMTVRWSGNGNPPGTQFFPERATDPDFTAPVQPGWTTSTLQVFGGLSYGTTYYFRVKARNSYGIETATVALHAAQLATDPAAAPINYVGISSITVAWSHNGNPSNSVYWVQKAAGPISAWWPFENDGTDPMGGNTATGVNGPVYASGRTGQGISLNGTNQYLSVPYNPTLALQTPQFTVSAWVKTTKSGAQAILGNYNPGHIFAIGANAANALEYYNGSTWYGSGAGSPTVTDGQWHHVAFVLSGGLIKFYRDGLFLNATAASYPVNSTNALWIGAAPSWANYFGGQLDDVVIHDRDLSAAEISDMYQAGSAYHPGAPNWANGTTREFTGLTSNVTYYFRVKAGNPSFDEAPSWVNLGSTITLVNQPLYTAPMTAYPSALGFDWGVNGNPAGVLYRVQASTSPDFYPPAVSQQMGSSAGWFQMANTPGAVGVSGINGNIPLVYAGGDFLYAFQGNNTPNFWRYSVSQNSWAVMSVAPGNTSAGAALVHDGGDYIYALQGNSSSNFWRYSISGNSWTVLPTAPAAIANVHSPMVMAKGSLYAAPGNGSTAFWRYDINNALWSSVASLPGGFYGAMTYPGFGDYIYAPQGGGNFAFWRYSLLTNSWGAVAGTPAAVMGWGGGMAAPGYGDSIYMVRGGGNSTIWRYSISGNNYAAITAMPIGLSNGGGAGAFAGGNLYILAGNGTSTLLRHTPSPAGLAPLSPLTTYYARIAGLNSAGNATPWTSLGSARTLPAQPRFLRYSPVTPNEITPEWYDQAGAEIFVQRALDTGFTTGLSDSGWLGVGVTSQTFSGLGISTQYYFRAKSREAAIPANESAWENWPGQATLPNPPSSMSHTFVSSASVAAAWAANGNGTGTQYYAERATDSGFTQNLGNSGWINHPTVAYNFTGLVPNTYYYFRVKARSASLVESSWTSLPQARTFANLPGAPVLLNVTGSQVQFDWTSNSNASGTEFWAEMASSSNPWVVASTAGWITGTSTVFSGLAPSTSYYFKVKARNAAYDEGLNSLAPAVSSYTIVLSTITKVPPAAPTGLAVNLTGVSAAQSDRLHIEWLDNSTGEDGFKLEKSANGVSFGLLTTLGAGATEFMDTGLTPNTSYYYRVKAYSLAGGDSLYSGVGVLYARAAAPHTPAFQQISSVTARNSWNTASNPGWTQFTAEISSASDFSFISFSSVTAVSPALFQGLVPNTSYYFRVRAENGNGVLTAYSAAVNSLTSAAPPASPASLEVNYTSASFSWAANGNPAGTLFGMDVSTASDFTGALVSSSTVMYSAAAQGLSPNVTYYMRVRAFNMASAPSVYVSPASPVATLAMPPAASALPYTVNATSVTVHWSTSGNSPHTQYNVQRSARDSSSFASVEDASLWQTGRSSWTFSAPSLVAGATYYFRIKARNSAGVESPAGATGWVVLPSTQTLPYLPGALPQDVFVSSINARWINGNQAGTPYLAEAFSDAGFTSLVSSSGWTADIASYMFTGLAPNTRYFIRAAARNTSGLETARVLLYSEYTRAAQPGAPLSDYVRTGNSVTVSWDKSGNPDPDTEYMAARASVSDFSAGLENSAWISANSYQFNGLTAGTTYYFRVKARNRNASPLETGWNVLPSTVTLPAPEPPSGLVLSYPDADSTDRLSVGWNDNSTAESGFRVYESADGSVFTIKDTLGSNAGTGPLSYLSLGLSVNARYYYKVAAFNANGEAYSEVVSTFTRAVAPSALPFTQVMTNSMRANWNTGVNPGGTQFHCELSTDPAFGLIAASTRTAGGTFLFTGLQANATHYGRVRAVNGSGVPTDYALMGSSQTIPLSLTIAVSDPGPAPMNQGQRFSFAKVVVTPSGSGAVLSGLAVDRIGDGVDADAARVGIWRDQNMDGAFQAGNDLEAGYAVFSSSRASVALNETLTAPATFFVTITAADNYMSWPGYTIGAAIASTASFSSPNSVIASMEPQAFTGTAVPVTKIADVLDIFGQSVVSMPNVSRGVYNTAFLKLTMNANRDRAYLNSVALQKLGSLSDANIAAIKVFYDANKNGTLEALAGDPLVSSGVDAFSSGQAVVNFVSPSTRAATNDVYFVTLDIIETAPLGATIGVRVPSAASFQLMAGTPDSVTLGSTPTDSAVPAVSDPPNRVFVTATPMGVAQVAQGESKALLKLELTADTGIAVVNLVKVQRSSSSLNSDYTGLSFYRDNAPLGEYGGSDTFIASGAVVSGQVNFGMAESITFTSTKTYFVVAHMSPSANTANQAGVLVQSGYITATSAQTTIVAGFPLNSGLAQITPTVDVVQITPDASMAPGVAYQSDSNVPMLGLRFKALSNAADISSLMITQAGSAQDGDISALRLFRDNGDGTFNPGNDTPVSGAYALSNGTAAVSFSSIQNVTTAESLYFIAADIAADAAPGRSSQLRLLNAAAINVLAPDVVSSTFPILSNVVNLEKLQAVVLVSTTGLAPAAAEAGTQNIKLVRIGLRSNQSTSQLNSLAMVRSGGGDADISKVALYWDANTNGLLEASEMVSSGTFSGGILSLPFGGLSRSLSVSTKTYYVTMDLSAAAPIGASLGVNFTNLSVQNPDTVEAGRLPFGSGGVLVAEPPVQLHSHFENRLAASITQGDRSVLVASMTLQSAAYTVSWTGIQLLRAGNGYDSDISAVRIYRDNGNGVWGGAAQETEIASGQFASGALTLSFSTETISASPLLYYVAVDVSETADPGKTFGINLPAASYMKMADPDYGDITDFPFSSSLASIAPTVDTLETVPVPLSLAPLLTQGDYRRSIGKITLRAATNAVSLSGVRFLQTGTMSDDSLAEAILYKDDGDGVYSQALDTPVTSPSKLSAGILQLAISPAQVLGQTSQTFWLAISVSSSAPVGTTFSLDCPSTAYFTVSSPDLVDASAFPFSFSLAGTLQDRPDQLMVKVEDRAPSSIYQGINATAMARLSFWASEDRVELSRVRVDLNGTVSQSDIARAALYADSDGNRQLDPAYDAFAASGTFTAGSAWLTFGTPQVITPSTAVYFLAYDISPTAVIGGEAGAGIMSSAYFDRSAPDTVAAVTSLQTRQAVIRDPRVPVPPGIAMLLADGKLTIEELSYAPYETMLDFKWEGTVYQGLLERVEYSVGAAPATGASAWTPAGLNRDIRITSLNLAHGATYYLSLRAKNVLGAFYSDIVSQRFVVDSYKPLIPPGAQAREEAGGVKLTWPAAAVGPSGVAHYVVEERAAGSPVWVAVTTTSARSMVVSRTGISIQSAKPAGAYYYRVSPVNNAGVTGDPTEPLAVKIDIGSLASISGVSAYPNPFDSRKTQVTVAFTLNKASPVKLAIYDVFGVKVKEITAAGVEGENLVRWDGSGASGKVSKGVYLCVIKAAGDSKLVKIAVKH